MEIPEWKKKAVNGVIKQIERDIKKRGYLSENWKHYLKTMSKNMFEIMKFLDSEFMNRIEKEI